MEKLSFNDLPQAVELLTTKVEAIESLLKAIYNTKNKEPPPEILNFEQAHRFLQSRGLFIERSTLYKKSSKGSVPFQKTSGRLVFKRADLEKWVESQFQPKIKSSNNNAVVKAAQNKLNN